MTYPTIGRIVHYRVSVDGYDKTVPAVITDVISEGVVSLCVLNSHNGIYFVSASQLDEDLKPRLGTWCWPPRN